MSNKPDIDPQETQEWLDALEAVLENEGVERAHFLLERLIDKARRSGAYLPYSANTAYVNTIPVHAAGALSRRSGHGAAHPLLHPLERHGHGGAGQPAVHRARRPHRQLRLQRHPVRRRLQPFLPRPAPRTTAATWSSSRATRRPASTPAPSWRAASAKSSSTTSARRWTATACPPIPHPWLMPDFWQFPTVSMGLGPIMAIYQARFMRYLQDRGLLNTEKRKVWAFMGDGEMDEPESLGAISLAARERLDNLVFVVNCNLQRLDGPVRGNGKIIQELEAVFRGAGWNVIKVIWGGYWDPLLARDKNGLLLKRMEECVDGDYQTYKAKGGAYTREHFFGKYPELAEMVANLTDEDIWRLNRGGHDPDQGLRGLRRGRQAAQGQAHGHPGQDGQGLRHGRWPARA